MLEDFYEYEETETTGKGWLESVNNDSRQEKTIETTSPVSCEHSVETEFMEKVSAEEISFTSKYTETEIRKLESNVRDLESQVSNAKSNVQHWQRCYDLSKSSGDLSQLRSVQSRLSNLEYSLKDARSRLNNAK